MMIGFTALTIWIQSDSSSFNLYIAFLQSSFAPIAVRTFFIRTTLGVGAFTVGKRLMPFALDLFLLTLF